MGVMCFDRIYVPLERFFKVKCSFFSKKYSQPIDPEGDRTGTLTLPEYIYATYNELMKNGWRMKEIDEMDMLGFLRLRAWDAQREHEKKKPRQRFIDEVWPGMKSG